MDYPETESLTDTDGLDELRNELKGHLPAIVAELEKALNLENLPYPIFVSIPSGRAVATVATPLDPNDKDWQRIDDIARRIIGEKVGIKLAFGTELACAATNCVMTVADLSPELVGPE
jgi:hypothetical protein